MRYLVMTLGSSILILSAGCGPNTCTLVLALEGLGVDVTFTDEQKLAAGVYTFSVSVPDETLTVKLALDPAQGLTQQSGEAVSNTTRVNAQLSTAPASGYLRIENQPGNRGGPKMATIVLKSEDGELGRLVLDSIRYGKHEPNGEGCGVSTSATAVLAIP